MSLYLLIEQIVEEGSGKDSIEVSITEDDPVRRQEVHEELFEKGLSVRTIYAGEIHCNEDQYLQSLLALNSLVSRGEGVWEGIEDIAKQAFLSGLACGRSKRVPVLTLVE